MSERTINTLEELNRTLARISFKPSCVNLDWKWETKTIYEKGYQTYGDSCIQIGWLVRTSFVRPDIETGNISRGFGRWEFIAIGSSFSSVAKTCWVLAEMIVKHELMEAFQVDEVTIFNPHNTVEELSIPDKVRHGWAEVCTTKRGREARAIDEMLLNSKDK